MEITALNTARSIKFNNGKLKIMHITDTHMEDDNIEYTLVINGDLNGDGTCDVIDASLAYLYSVDMEEASEIEIIAANGCVSDELDANSYQNVVNMCLAS